MELVLHYAAIGFRPFEEIGEFVNVGVLAVETHSRYLGYRLLPSQRTRRIRACFPEVDISIYRTGLRRLENELSALAIETNLWEDEHSSGSSHPAQRDLFLQEGNVELFHHLTRPRTSPFFHPVKGTRLASDMDVAVDELFARYVEHQNLTPIEYEEKKLVRELKQILRRAKLDRFYRECPRVGSETYHVGIPLAYLPGGDERPFKAIKPLNLTQCSPTRIYTHGDEWISKVNRLRSLGMLPESFLFAVSMAESGPERQAAEDICDGLAKAGVQVASIKDVDKILSFAKIEEPEYLELVGE
ncbi:MAG: DUF3037 domain-containing protein [Verrucomicrobiales bacterium]|nr:DUF3037 domain-containing protein [Verrucomicrobiales bacterium]